ncbi:MAG TPA: sugar ABC transporter ATP-binding protein [Acetobacteraceae bacterium]|jgi:ribose transport system ATP-binding protein|nr:sugar ABC transporter ATP-binding protein [Acetobacteraceae bacterium]
MSAAPAATPEAAAAIAAQAVSKAFGGVQALRTASFAARGGEVHALVGENGAGKSTLIKILGGRIPPDAGSLLLDGRPLRLAGTADAARHGIGTVFQELTLLPWMSVAENLLIGREPRSPVGLIRRSALPDEAEALLAGLGIHHIDPRALAAEVSLAERQIIEIARVIIRRPRILLLDEPTSSLVEREVAWLFARIRELSAAGTAVVFTSHRWNEITSIADRITIFRNGAEVGTYTEIAEDEAITLMAGRRVEALYPALPPVPANAPPVLELAEGSLNGAGELGFSLAAGEILGIGGLAGQGHRELFLGLFGAPPLRHGRIRVGGRVMRISSPADAIHAGLGIALVPEDRKSEGLLLPLSVRDNLTLPILARLSRLGVIRGAAERRMSREIISRLGVVTPSAAQPVGALSGGNQQKVLLGRWLLADSRILLLYDVTRGVDVATKHEIYELMTRLAGEGRAILFYSSDTEELAHLCHRVLVLRGGRIVATLTPPALDAEAIVAAAMREAERADAA